MKKLLNYNNYNNYNIINENRQDLYHITTSYRFKDIIKGDLLKVNEPAIQMYNKPKKSISVTRSNNYTDEWRNVDIRIVLDNNKLYLHGYKSVPVDEVGVYKGYGKGQNVYNFSKKWNIDNLLRKSKHNIDSIEKPSKSGLELEFEERYFKNIKNLGKYIKFIDFSESEFERNKTNSNYLSEYLKEYPHIKIRIIKDQSNLWKKPELQKNTLFVKDKVGV